MLPTEKERARRRRAQARGTCPQCGTAVDLICWTCRSALCRVCRQPTGSLYTRTCRTCLEGTKDE